MDVALPVHIKDILNQFFIVVGLIFILAFVSPYILIAVVPLVLLFLFIQTAYLRSSRQLKRLMSVNRSPLNSHIEETLNGATTIRAFCHETQFTNENEQLIETYQQSQYAEFAGYWNHPHLRPEKKLLFFWIFSKSGGEGGPAQNFCTHS